MAQIRISHELSKMDIHQVYNDSDPNFLGEFPQEKGFDPNDLNLPHEIRKFGNMRIPE